MSGVITTRTIILHAGLVLKFYGVRCFARCLLASMLPGTRTFLSIVFS